MTQPRRTRLPAIGWLLLIHLLASCQNTPRHQSAAEPTEFELLETTIPDLQEALDTGRITSRQLVEMYLERIEAYDQQGPTLNAIATINPHALDQAQALDQERASQGPRGPLHGIPVIVKDNIETMDMQTAAGSLSLAGWIPPHDAFVIERLRQAGAVILAKANLHEFAMGTTNVGSLFGQTRNPYALDRVPGGSSGGTGAAIAANFASVGLGTDTCSSIRSPSSHNSLVGLRGTQGLVSRTGIIPLSHTQDIAGPMARNVTDLALVLDALGGYDAADPQTADSFENIPESYGLGLAVEALQGARIGLLTQFLPTEPEDQDITGVIRRAMDEMGRQGAEVIEVQISDLEQLMENPLLVGLYETRDDMNEYFARHPSAPVRSLQEILDSGKYHPQVGDRLRSRQESPPDSQEYLEHLWKRTLLRRAILQVMAEHRLDALAYPINLKVAEPIGQDGADSNGCFSANSGLPAITVPAGFTQQSLAVGLELLGRPWSEARLIALAYSYEQATGHRRPPDTTPPREPGR